MGQHLLNVDALYPVLNLRDQTIPVLPNVENRARPDSIGVPVRLPHVSDITPASFFHGLEPCI
jgi:hypothetical protein